MFNAIHKAHKIREGFYATATVLLLTVFFSVAFYRVMESSYMKQYDPKVYTGVQKKY